jgi:putative membrane protein insertion efficiency factor
MTNLENNCEAPFEALAATSNRSPLATSLDQCFRLYQSLTSHRPSPCRFYPTCSTYGREAVAEHGALRGLYLTVRRLLRCHPLGSHGVDLVPERKG